MADNLAFPEGFAVYGTMAGRAGPGTISAVVSSGPEVVVVPGDRPDLLQAIRDLRREAALAPVPVVVAGAEDAPACYAAGADECVERLGEPEVARVLARAARMRAVWAGSETDVLTGCYTRRLLESYAKSCGLRSVSLFMTDLDHFKRVNDTYGHPAGDTVLRRFGLFLRESVRRTDIVARWGGEEFVVLFAPAGDGLARAEGLCREWAATRIRLPDGQLISSTFSGGLATGAASLENLIRAADQALYQAKRAGRNRVVRAGEGAGPAGLVDRIASAVGDFTVLAALQKDGRGYRVTEARGPFAGQLVGEVVELRAEDGVHGQAGGHWLFGLSGETVLAKGGDGAVLVGRKGRFGKTDLARLRTLIRGVF